MNNYRISHSYDCFYYASFVSSNYEASNMLDIAAYIQLLAEESIAEDICVYNPVIADALVEFFDCDYINFEPENLEALEETCFYIDIFTAREERYNKFDHLNKLYNKNGLSDFLIKNCEY